MTEAQTHPVRGTDDGAEATPINLAQYERLARQLAAPDVWDYIAGGSEDEVALRGNRAAFTQWALRTKILSGVRSCDLSVEILGARLTSPVLIAPMGHQALAHPEGEAATVRGANAAHSLMIVSTMSNCTLEEVAAAAQGPLWFQLYVMKDRNLTVSLIRRAEANGYRALVLTVDAPVLGRRERDLRNGFTLPPHVRPRNLSAMDAAHRHRQNGVSAVAAHADATFDAAINWDTLSWLQSHTRLPILLKGVLTAEDARRAVELGVRGLIVSNHGGRQLDSAQASLDALPEVVDGAGGAPVLLDGGIRRGTDALKARALGATAVLVGRPVLWGLIAQGAHGVQHVLQLLHAEIEHAMALAGRSRWAHIDRSLVSRIACGCRKRDASP